MITKNAVYHLLGDQTVAYHPVLAKVFGGIEAGIFLSKMLVWNKTDGEWIARTQAELETETGLSRRNQETARRKLREAGIIEDRLMGVPATVHYRLDIEAIASALNAYYGTDEGSSSSKSPDPAPAPAIPPSLNEQTGLAEPYNPVCTNQPNWIGRTVPSSLPAAEDATRPNLPQNVQIGRNVQTQVNNDFNYDLTLRVNTTRRTKKSNSTEPVWSFPENLDNPTFKAAWAEWEEYRAKTRKKMSQVAGNRLLKRMAEWGTERAVDAIGFSIANDYQGIFEDSRKANGQKSAASYPAQSSPMPMNIDLGQYNLDGVL